MEYMKGASVLGSSDSELFEQARRMLYSAVIGDILDLLGRRHQFLSPQIRPLRHDLVVCGRAMTVLEADDPGGDGSGRKNEVLERPFGLMLRALDDLKKDEVYLCSGASPTYALWGELMSLCARNRGAAGAVLNGWSRDTRGILALNFPCFSYGAYAQDQRPRGKVVDFRCPLQIGTVEVRPGDIIFGDSEGVVVIPRDMEQEVCRRALEKARVEKRVFTAIKDGVGAQEAWDTYGIL
jgi:regulator of RNase E activity RraA